MYLLFKEAMVPVEQEEVSLFLPDDDEGASNECTATFVDSSSGNASSMSTRRRSSVGFQISSKQLSIRKLTKRRTSLDLEAEDSYDAYLPKYSQADVDDMISSAVEELQQQIQELKAASSSKSSMGDSHNISSDENTPKTTTEQPPESSSRIQQLEEELYMQKLQTKALTQEIQVDLKYYDSKLNIC